MTMPLPDRVFTLPEHVTDEGLRQAYEVIVARLRTEAEHLPVMATATELLIERIAYCYIEMRHRETQAEADGFESTTANRAWQRDWLDMLQEFHRQIRAYDPSIKEDLIVKVRDAINSALAGLSNADDVRARLAFYFETAGL